LTFKVERENQQFLSIYKPKGYSQVYLPRDLVNASNFQDVLRIVGEVSEETDTTYLFRSMNIEYNTNGHGRLLSSNNDYKGTLTFFGEDGRSDRKIPNINGNTIQKKPLTSITPVEMSTGDLLVKTTNSTAMLNLLSQRLNSAYQLNLSPETLIKRPSWYWNISERVLQRHSTDTDPLIVISLEFYAVFLFAYLVEKNRKIMIYRLNGLGSFAISNLLFLREFGIVTLLLTFLSSLFIIQGFSFRYLLFVAGSFLITCLISYAAVWLVGRRSFANQLNNKSFFRFGHYFLMASKFFAFFSAIMVTMVIALLFNIRFNLFSEPSVAGYGTLNPVLPIGYHLTDKAIPEHPNQALFEYAEKNGGLSTQLFRNNSPAIEKITGHKPDNPPDGFQIPPINKLTTMYVNDNYLKKYRIFDEHGKLIKLDPATADGILLVSKKYKHLENDLIQYYAENTNFVFNTKNIRIIWMKNGQEMTLLDGKGTKLVPELLPVTTLNNAGSIYKSNLTVAGMDEINLLFPIKGSPEKTYDAIKPALEADGELDQYPVFFTPNDLRMRVLTGNKLSPVYPYINAAFCFLLFVGMIAASVGFYFKRMKLKIAVQRLQGASYLRSYWPLLLFMALQYIVGGAYIVRVTFPLATLNSPTLIKEMLVVYTVIELAITGWMLYRLEKHNVLNTLKGE
jgi:hypothetical protein